VPERAVAIAVNDIVTPEDRMVAVVVAPHVRHWRDLAGKKVAVNAVNSMAGLAARVRLAREGVTDAQWVEMPMQNHGLALAGGYVSATASNEPFVTQTLLRDDGRLLDWIAGGPPLERAIYTALVVSTALLRAKPALLERLLLAHLEAARWINANHQAARAILGRRLGITDELAQRIQMPRWPSDGRFDPALFAGMQRVFIEGGVVSDIVPLERVHDPALLSRLQVR
jgi:NitT/TauT family transport system substrate-binding protein